MIPRSGRIPALAAIDFRDDAVDVRLAGAAAFFKRSQVPTGSKPRGRKEHAGERCRHPAAAIVASCSKTSGRADRFP
jgi:hypothetical protein